MICATKNKKTPAKAKKHMRTKDVQNFFKDKPIKSEDFLRESYCRLLEEYLANLGIRQHWGKTLEWKMKKFPTEAKEMLDVWATIHNIDSVFLIGIEENGEVNKSITAAEGGIILKNGERYPDSLYARFIKLVDENC